MKLVDVESQFDGNKICFFFTADKRIDFRALVKDLAPNTGHASSFVRSAFATSEASRRDRRVRACIVLQVVSGAVRAH